MISDLLSGRDEWKREIVIQNISQRGIDGILFEERVLRSERWKLILRDFAARPDKAVDGLYDMEMENDPGETNNMFSERQDLVMELAGRLGKWGDQHGDALAVKLGRNLPQGQSRQYHSPEFPVVPARQNGSFRSV